MRIYEINTRVHCRDFDDVTEAELADLAGLGFDAVWLMGVWQISNGALRISKIVSEDYQGSPYAIPDYRLNPSLGGEQKFKALVERAHRAGLRVILDFVSNHMAVDSPWIGERPDFFIRSDSRARKQSTADFFLHPTGEVVAFGRDPYFPPWHDTAQLDYTNEALRRAVIETLKSMSRYADGVRCDMAMLVLRDYIRQQWYPLAPPGWFDERMPSEFWDQAIGQVKAARPDFAFIAEAYWEKEQQLLKLGFDLAYDKKLYDGLVARNADHVRERLGGAVAMVEGSLYFIENHDEPRAAAVFTNARHNLAAAALILSSPGSVLIHEGQMEGKRERLPVQRIRPLINEPADLELKAGYMRLLALTREDVFRAGSFHLFDSRVYGVVSFFRQTTERVVVYLGQISDAWHSFSSTLLDITAVARAVGAQGLLRVVDLITTHSILVEEKHGVFQFRPNQLSKEEADYCLIEVRLN